MKVANALAYYKTGTLTDVKSFIVHTPAGHCYPHNLFREMPFRNNLTKWCILILKTFFDSTTKQSSLKCRDVSVLFNCQLVSLMTRLLNVLSLT